MRRRAGFTAIELLGSVVVAAGAVLVTLALVHGMTGMLRSATGSLHAGDNGRVAIDEVTRLLRGAGSGTDYSSGQDRFVYCGPFTIALNANYQPIDDPAMTGEPTALDIALADATVTLEGGASYTPEATFATGAETIVLTIDSDRDGQITTADAGDDDEETSQNPNDFVLKTFVYGVRGGSNSVEDTGLALLRGPTGGEIEPLFRYWIDRDNDPTTAAELHGDANSDGFVSGAEAADAGPVPDDELGVIERVEITATTEPERPTNDADYPKTLLRSTVSFRNRVSTAAHIVGTVFHDLDHDGMRDSGEFGIRDVVITCSNNSRTKTDVNGHYSFVMNPGIYTVTEINPFNYASTTADQVQVNAAPGDWARVDFGDRATTGTGRILGVVFNDDDSDGERDDGERPIEGVQIFLDNGMTTYTNSNGRYTFTVQTQDYVVTEVDSVGYQSITPNVVEVNLTTLVDSVVVDFADKKIEDFGTIDGIVFADADNDGVRDVSEFGIPNVTVTLDGTQATSTDTQGEFTFTATVGEHEVTETDPPGFTSSTVNTVNVTVVARQTVNVLFGDIAQQDITFQEIVLGNTERALCITSFETGEDSKSDMDIALGTHYVGGRNDLLVWWNNRSNASTPNANLFSTTPSYQRAIAADVNAIATWDMNGDAKDDVVTALGSSFNNIAVWVTQSSGANRGQLPNSPTQLYSASGLLLRDVVAGAFDDDGRKDIAIASNLGFLMSKLEIWKGNGAANFNRNSQDIYPFIPGTSSNWGDIISLAAADFSGDGISDLVVAAQTGSNESEVSLLIHNPEELLSMDYYREASIRITGVVSDVLALDMKEDDRGDIDIVVAVNTTGEAGRIEVWNNRGDNHFGIAEEPDVTPDDTADPGGAPLSLCAAKIDNDIFPDIIVGTRSSLYTGKVLLYRAFGFLPSNPQQVSTTAVGEVITMTSADYNKDGAPDLSVGTRTSATAGKVVIYFNQRSSL